MTPPPVVFLWLAPEADHSLPWRPQVLSVVAQQVSMLQEACKSKQYRINFEGTGQAVAR